MKKNKKLGIVRWLLLLGVIVMTYSYITNTNSIDNKSNVEKKYSDVLEDIENKNIQKVEITAINSTTSKVKTFYKDSDSDGLSDTDEVDKYKTDPQVADTDGDTVLDGIEITNEFNPLDGSDPKDPKKYVQNSLFGLAGKEDLKVITYETEIQNTLVPDLQSKLNEQGIGVEYFGIKEPNVWLGLLGSILPVVLMFGLLIFFMKMMTGGNNKAMEFGKSRAKLDTGKRKITYGDVAGLDEEKFELKEIVDFLKAPKKYTDMGARIPKGTLLVGPPGTGKTLLARAVAGEANVPFYTISGSDFVEMFVGTGASRVRDMFKQAKTTAPCVIFIDEIDAVGRQRGTGIGGGHDEREQTLNALLVEMDGFAENSGIIILAATNRADVLDAALLRPGRFDRQILVNNPDIKGRIEILKVHSRNKKLSAELNFKAIAERTPGFSGADLENLMNEAALLAVRENKKIITMSEIDEAVDRVMMGPAKTSRQISVREKNVIAYHEAGHCVLGLKLDNASEVHKVTIIPRGMAGGYNLMLPKEETMLSSKTSLLETITVYLGGRVAEEIVFDEITTGAHNDFERATHIARSMVTEYGMSSLGPIQFEKASGSVFLGRDYSNSKNFSDAIALEIDQEIRKIISRCYEDAKKVLSENRELLNLIAEMLVKYETLTKEEIKSLEDTGKMPIRSDEEIYNDIKIVEEIKDVSEKNNEKTEEVEETK